MIGYSLSIRIPDKLMSSSECIWILSLMNCSLFFFRLPFRIETKTSFEYTENKEENRETLIFSFDIETKNKRDYSIQLNSQQTKSICSFFLSILVWRRNQPYDCCTDFHNNKDNASSHIWDFCRTIHQNQNLLGQRQHPSSDRISSNKKGKNRQKTLNSIRINDLLCFTV